MKNIRNLILSLSLFFVFGMLMPQLTIAENVVVDLSMHGPELRRAPFDIRHKFEKQTKEDWYTSSYQDRKKFLTEYYINLQEEQELQNVKNRETQKQVREIEQQKRQEKRIKIQQERAARSEAKQELRQKKMEGKKFQRMVRDEKRKLDNARVNH